MAFKRPRGQRKRYRRPRRFLGIGHGGCLIRGPKETSTEDAPTPAANTLTDVKIRNAKPGAKPVRLFDGGGMYLDVSPAGGKLWRLKYRFQRREKRLALGQYPEITLAKARDRWTVARKLLAHGIDPSAAKRAEKAAQADTFEAVAWEWRSKQAPRWGTGHGGEITRRLAADVFPWSVASACALDLARLASA